MKRAWALAAGLAVAAQMGGARAEAQTMPAMTKVTSATTRASVAADQTTPRGALKVLANAMESGDAGAMRGVLLSVSPQEQRMAQSMADLATAFVKLRVAAEHAYGQESATALTGANPASKAENMARIDAAVEQVNGDEATIRVDDSGQTPPVTLKKVDGKWHVPMAEMAHGVDAKTIDERLSQVDDQTKVLTDVAGNISNKTYRTVADAQQALREKMLKAAMAYAAAATKPAVQSSTQPASKP